MRALNQKEYAYYLFPSTLQGPVSTQRYAYRCNYPLGYYKNAGRRTVFCRPNVTLQP